MELTVRRFQWSFVGLSADYLVLVHPDLAAPNMIKFGIESKFHNPTTSTQKLKTAVLESLLEMKLVTLEAEEVDVKVASHL